MEGDTFEYYRACPRSMQAAANDGGSMLTDIWVAVPDRVLFLERGYGGSYGF